MFGAYFGLAASYTLGKPGVGHIHKSMHHLTIMDESEASNISDLFSLVGTIFLWIYWPSFVGGPLIADAATQQRAVVNTVLALSASTLTAFAFSAYFSAVNKFRPVDIQNATLAGMYLF
jgi:ammonium transporter Rh